MSLAKDRKAVDFVKRSLDLVTCLSRRETTQGEVQMVVVEPPAVLCLSKVTFGSGGEEDRTSDWRPSLLPSARCRRTELATL